MPEAVHGDAGGKGVGGIDQPLGEAEAILGCAGGKGREHGGDAGGDLLGLVAVVAAGEDEGFAGLFFIGRHDIRRHDLRHDHGGGDFRGQLLFVFAESFEFGPGALVRGGRGFAEVVVANPGLLVFGAFVGKDIEDGPERFLAAEVGDLARIEHAVVDAEVVEASFEEVDFEGGVGIGFCVGLRAGDGFRADRLAVDVDGEGAGARVVHGDVVHVVGPGKAVPGAELLRAELHVETRDALLHAGEFEVVQPELELALGEDRVFQFAVNLQPEGGGEGFVVVEGRYVGEDGLGLTVKIRAAIDGSVGVGEIAFQHAAVLVVAGGIGEVAVEFIVGEQAVARHGLEFREFGFFPGGLLRGDGLFGKGFFVGGDSGFEFGLALLLLFRGELQEGLGVAVAAVEALLTDVIEEGEEAVEVALRNGIVLMIVAARAAHGQAHPGGGGGFEAIDDVLDLILLGNRAAFEINHVVAVEAAGEFLFEGGVGE